MTTSLAKRKNGRPIEWTPKLIAKECIALEKWIAKPENYFFTSFLTERDLHKEQVRRMCDYSPKFRALVDKAREIQELRLVEMAVTRKGDPGFIKFILANKNGWRERNEISGDAANPLTFVLERISSRSQDPLAIEDQLLNVEGEEID